MDHATPQTAMPTARRPVIGLNMAVMEGDLPLRAKAVCHLHYIDAVAAAGGLPLLIAPYRDQSLMIEALARVDGMVFIGGDDYDPATYGGRPQPAEQLVGERRNRFDLRLAEHVIERTALPVLGVCGGHQLINIARGGALVQDIATDWPAASLSHDSTSRTGTPQAGNVFRHVVRLTRGSAIARIVGGETLATNSWHHQAIDPKRIGRGLVATGWSEDGVIEAVELPGERLVIGVQWHPERLGDEPEHRALFGALVRSAAAGASRRPAST
ncbi:MAG TPA: gamma-glutamyl-gamma-aminobutyrate hydrolase family protein [Planctomycetota bacterium]|nr:gamma-glutamyl-gamma-aminobutyrate hydrolase family protein [Planctomycetota bacterium]